MIQLPVELQRKCVHFVQDIPTLRSLRLVNKANAVATEALFHSIKVVSDEKSVERYTKIAKDAELNALVRNVVFHTAHSFDKPSDHSISYEDKALAVWEAAAISQLPEFQNVNGVQLRFASRCVTHLEMGLPSKKLVETPSHRAKVLQMFFEAIAKANYVDSITIINLQDHTQSSVYELQALEHVRSRLKKVHLQLITASRRQMRQGTMKLLELSSRCNFFNIHLFNNWIPTVRENITHLTLYATRCYWGVFPSCNLRSIFFPNLRSLALGRFTIAHDWQVDWITSHGSTLRSLILDRCPIVIAVCMLKEQMEGNWELRDMNHLRGQGSESMYTKYLTLRWAPILDRFSDSLPKLRHFAMGRGDWGRRKMFEERYQLVSGLEDSRYVVFDCAIELYEWVECRRMEGHQFVNGDLVVEFPGDEEDEKSLKTLTRVVYERA